MPSHHTPITCSNCGKSDEGTGSKGMCQRCFNATSYRANREERLAAQKAYASQHKAQKATYMGMYRVRRGEDLLAKKREYHHANRDVILPKKRIYWAANAVAIAAKRKAWRLANPTEARSRKRAEYAAHSERYRRYRWEHRDRGLDMNRAYRAAHRLALLAYSHRYEAAHRAERAAKQRAYIRAHPEKNREYSHRWRARRYAGFVSPVSAADIYRRDGGICQICHRPVDEKAASMDHILPLARGGTHEPRNVRLTHRTCNTRRQQHGAAQMRLLG